MTVETFTLTGEYTSGGDPGRGFVYLTPDQTVVDAPGDTIAAGVKIRIPLVDGAFSKPLLPTGIGYHARPILYDGYPPEADFTVAPGTTLLDMADVTDDYLVPLDPTGLEAAQAYTDARTGVAVSTTAGLIAALAELATDGGLILLPEAFTLSSGVSVPQGVTIRGSTLKKSAVTYSGTGTAFTFTGTASTDTRLGGGLEHVAIKLAGVGATGVKLVDTRKVRIVDVDVLGNNATGSSINAGSVGFQLLYSANNVGCSWNDLYDVYAEYCGVGVDLNGSAHTPPWVTRNRITGFAQTCTTGVRGNGANTNRFEFHPQNCTTAWDLTNCDTNDIYTVCESNTTDWTADSASTNNRVRGAIGLTGTIAATEGTKTRWWTTEFVKFPPSHGPVEWDGAGSNVVRQPLSGQSGTTHEAWWTRDNTDALVQMFYLERGVASPRLRVVGPAKFENTVDFSTATVSGIPAPIALSARLDADVLLTLSSTTLQNVTGLAIAVAANTNYKVEGFIIYDASTVADLQLGWTVPGGAVLSWSIYGLRTAASTGTDTTTRAMIGTSGTGAAGGAGVGTSFRETCRLVGTLTVGSTAGTLQLQAAQNASEATQVTVRTLSRIDTLLIS